MEKVRYPAVAGLFYPENPQELRRQVSGFLAVAQQSDCHPKALVAPHAGYVYSGPIAGIAYAQLRHRQPPVERVIMFGPAHRLAFRGIARPSASAFLTPLGEVAVDRSAWDEIAGLPQVVETDAPFNGEHCLEVQLPFLQLALGDFKLVPFLVGDADPAEVTEVIDRLWGGEETLIVISSDLSHYLDYRSAQAMDRATSDAIERLDPTGVSYHHACGRVPLNGLLTAAKRHGLHAVTLDQRNSGDTAGPRDRVVGYGAYAFS